MNATDPPPVDPASFRRRAEDRARDLAGVGLAEPALHELQVRQIQVELQNEELRRIQAELQSSRDKYFELYDLAPVGYCTLSELGLIRETNLTAAELLGVARSALVDEPFARFILADDRDLFHLYRRRLLDTGQSQSLEARLVSAAAPRWRSWPACG